MENFEKDLEKGVKGIFGLGLGFVGLIFLVNVAWWSFLGWCIYKLVTHFTS